MTTAEQAENLLLDKTCKNCFYIPICNGSKKKNTCKNWRKLRDFYIVKNEDAR